MIDYNEYTDEELVQMLANNNEQAFDLLYERHWNHLYQSAFYILKDTDSAKDIVQDVFIWFWEQRQVLNINNVKAYLKAAIRFKATNYIRFGNTRESLYDRLSKFPQNTLPATGDEIIEIKELQQIIQNAINQLPEKCREIYILSKVECLSNREIAERLGISVKTVEAQMTIALKRLRSEITLYILFIIIFHVH